MDSRSMVVGAVVRDGGGLHTCFAVGVSVTGGSGGSLCLSAVVFLPEARISSFLNLESEPKNVGEGGGFETIEPGAMATVC